MRPLLGCLAILAQDKPAPIYSSDQEHPWNLLHDLLFIRAMREGKLYREEGPDPPLVPSEKHLVEGESHKNALAFLDKFLMQNSDRLVLDPAKRAVMHHDLWTIFDTTAADPKEDHQGRRRELQKRLAALMRRLALSRDEMEALPDNLLESVRAGTYPKGFNGAKPFLPDEILDERGPWVMVSNSLRPEQVPAPEHVQKTQGHALFFIFYRHPGGRQATLDHFCGPEKLKTPEGLHVALLRRMALVDSDGSMRPTHITQSLQIRVYRKWPDPRPFPALEDEYNVPFEFLMSRRDHSLRAVGADEASLAPLISERTGPFEGYSPKGSCSPASGATAPFRAFGQWPTRGPRRGTTDSCWGRPT